MRTFAPVIKYNLSTCFENRVLYVCCTNIQEFGLTPNLELQVIFFPQNVINIVFRNTFCSLFSFFYLADSSKKFKFYYLLSDDKNTYQKLQ